MRSLTLTVAIFAAIALSTGGLVAVAQTTKPAPSGTTSNKMDRRDTNKDGVISEQEKSDARKKAAERFKAADKNNDGGLSREEAKAAQGYSSIEKNFDAMDTNKDGKVTPEERRAWSQTNRAKKSPGETGTKTSGSTSKKTGDGGLLPPR
jgi:Ca2+-binding EF-hand superfamily protein